MVAMAAVVLFSACNNDDDMETPNKGNVEVNLNPSNNATDVQLNKVISANFSEEMNAASFNTTTFTLKEDNNEVSGDVSYSGFSAIFTPSNTLKQNVVYTANISKDVKKASGESISENITWEFTTGTSTSGLSPIDLGTSGNYVILAKTAINNSPTSAITGDIALSPAAASFITGFSIVQNTGFATSSQITGKIYAADMADPTPSNLTTAVSNMETAYNNAAGLSSPDFTELATGNIGGQTLVPGLYKWTNTVTIPTDLVISGGPNDVWVFQIAGDLTVSSSVNIALSGGAKAENIFWQVAGEVTIGTTANFKGVILSMTGITLQTGATLSGRALAQTAVILDTNIVTQAQ